MNAVLASVLFALSAGLVALLLLRAVLAVPAEHRAWRDQAAFGFRLGWPLIRFLAHHVDHLVPIRYRRSVQAQLVNAGVDFSLSPVQFIAARLVLGLIGAATGAVLGVWLAPEVSPGGIPVTALVAALLLATLGYVFPVIWLRDVRRRRRRAILHLLPFYLDIITLTVEAGSHLVAGFRQAVRKTQDSPLRDELKRVLRDVRAGKTRALAMQDMAERAGCAELTSLVSSLVQAERMGSALGPVLRAQADQIRTKRFQLAEKRAMEAPVKLLIPLVGFFLPTVFLIVGFLVLSKLIQSGVVDWAPLVRAYYWPG